MVYSPDRAPKTLIETNMNPQVIELIKRTMNQTESFGPAKKTMEAWFAGQAPKPQVPQSKQD
jgi:hypothetical protein